MGKIMVNDICYAGGYQTIVGGGLSVQLLDQYGSESSYTRNYTVVEDGLYLLVCSGNYSTSARHKITLPEGVTPIVNTNTENAGSHIIVTNLSVDDVITFAVTTRNNNKINACAVYKIDGTEIKSLVQQTRNTGSGNFSYANTGTNNTYFVLAIQCSGNRIMQALTPDMLSIGGGFYGTGTVYIMMLYGKDSDMKTILFSSSTSEGFCERFIFET